MNRRFRPARGVSVAGRTLWIAALFLLAASPAGAQARRVPTVDDLLDLVQVTSAKISPDGARVLFTRSELRPWKDNKRATAVWMARADGSNAYRFLAHERDRSPAWSPDGARVAFLSNRDGAPAEARGAEADRDSGPQIWLIRTDGGEAWKLTDHKGNIRSFEWAPDSGRMFFVSENLRTDAEKAAEKAGDDALYVDEGANGQRRSRFSKLWTIDLATKQERALTGDGLLIGDFTPSPDGGRVAVTYRRDNERNGQYRSEIAVVDVASGQMKDLTANQAPESDPRWSPDGARVSFTASSVKSWELAEPRLWTVPATGGAWTELLRFDGSVREHYWRPDGRTIVFAATKNGRGGVYELEVAAGRVRAIASGEWAGGLDSVSRDARTGAGVISAPREPGDVHVWNLAAGTRVRVTNANPQIESLELADVRAVTWKSRDGTPIEGLLWLPADVAQAFRPAKPLPLLLSVHGGPAGVWTTSFRGMAHVYAGLGWAVLEPNVRGSSSYGDALLRGNIGDIGGGDYQDLMTGVDHVIAQGFADPARVAIRGWSYGGILGGWTITQTDRFKAASLGAMVSDWTSEYAMGFNHDIRLWYIGGTPWENPEGYRRQSPFTHIAKVKTPTILLHGEADTTDTVEQSMIFYQGLKDRGVAARFIRFPREPHGLREPHHLRVRDTEEIAWLMKHTLGVEWKAPERKDTSEEKKTTTP